MLRLDVASLTEDPREEELAPSPESLGLDSNEIRDIRVVARLDRDGDRVVVRLEVAATARLVCDRSAVEFEQDLKGTHGVMYAPEASPELSEEVLPLEEGDTIVDLTDAVRDTLLLAIPLRRIAPGAEALDIDLKFGALDEADIDPRWEALKKLKSGDSSDRALTE